MRRRGTNDCRDARGTLLAGRVRWRNVPDVRGKPLHRSLKPALHRWPELVELFGENAGETFMTTPSKDRICTQPQRRTEQVTKERDAWERVANWDETRAMQELTTAINNTVGFLQGMAKGFEHIAPSKSERCRSFADTLLAAYNATLTK